MAGPKTTSRSSAATETASDTANISEGLNYPRDLTPSEGEGEQNETSEDSGLDKGDQDAASAEEKAEDTDEDETEMTTPAENDPNTPDEEFWIHLYHHILIVALLQPSKPTVYLYNTAQLQYLDAYFEGKISPGGIVGIWPPRRDTPSKQIFLTLCEALVPGLQKRIKALSEKNWREKPENKRVDVGRRQQLWKFVITPEMISQYREIRQEIDVEGEIVTPEAHPELLDFLEQAVAEQYDTTTWKHKHDGRKIVLKQKPLHVDETFEPSEGQIQAFFDGKDIDSGLKYQQQDMIPEIRDTPINKPGQQEHFVLPEMKSIIIPPKSKKGLVWKYRKTSDTWWRADGLSWYPSLVLRKFLTSTNEYVSIGENLGLLATVDPNDQVWARKYNSWIQQWNRRSTKAVTVTRKHWSDDEIATLYREVNKVVRKHGLDAYDRLTKTSFAESNIVKINAVRGLSRPTESVASMMRRKKGPIFDLIQRGKGIKARLDAGEILRNEERYPEDALPVAAASDTQTDADNEEEEAEAEEDVEGEEEEVDESTLR